MTRTKDFKTTIKSDAEADKILMNIAILDNHKMKTEAWATEQEQRIREQAKAMLVMDRKSGETVDDAAWGAVASMAELWN